MAQKTNQRKGFNFITLGVLGACALSAVALSVIAPVNKATHAPKAMLPLAGAIEVDLRNIHPVSTANANAFIPSRPQHTAENLQRTFDAMGFDLAAVRAGQGTVPRFYLTSLPQDMADIKQSDVRKDLFFKAMLPIVLQINEEKEANRKRLWRLKHEQGLGRTLAAEDRVWLAGLSEDYGRERGDIDALLAVVDTLPPSLILAQAAEESGWGTSRFAREGNALFGQWTFNPEDKGIVPAGRGEGKTHRIKAFDSVEDSLRAYIHNLNTHRAYRKLRAERAAMRRQGKPVTGMQLALTLDKYSERGMDYVRSIQSLIERNDLQHFDGARLRSAPAGRLMI